MWFYHLVLRNSAFHQDHDAKTLICGYTPLVLNALKYGRKDVATKLLKAGADPDVVDKKGHTALSWAAMKNNMNAMKLLLKAGADPNKEDKNGKPVICGHAPLVLNALKYGRKDVATLLLQAGADPNVVDRNGNTALQLGCHEKQHEVNEASS